MASTEISQTELAICPSCHTQDPEMTTLAVSNGAYWQCTHCRSPWDARRLATVAAYAAWESGQTPTGG